MTVRRSYMADRMGFRAKELVVEKALVEEAAAKAAVRLPPDDGGAAAGGGEEAEKEAEEEAADPLLGEKSVRDLRGS